MTLGFVTNADFLLRFYEICMEYGIEDEQQKAAILYEMARQEPDQCSVFKTKRTKDQVTKDLAKNFGNVLHIKPKKDK